jgi:HK97 gp10 family phage protein
MGGGVLVKLKGIGDVNEALKALEREFGAKTVQGKVLVPSVREAMQPVLSAAISNAPRDTGGLALSLQVEARRPTNRDRRSHYITQTDTVIAAVTTASGKKLARMSEGKGLLRARKRLAKMGFENAESFTGVKSDARVIAQEFGTARNGAKPYLRPALEANAQSTVNRLGEILKRRIAEFRSKQGK